jgi:hypothetical protein
MENSAVEDIKNKIAAMLESQDDLEKAPQTSQEDTNDTFFKDLLSKI